MGCGWFKGSTAFRRCAERARRSFVRRRLCWAPLAGASAALFRSAEPHGKSRLKPMPRTSSQVSPQTYARPLLDPTLKCCLAYTAPAYRSLPRMLPILRACDTLRSKMRGVLPEIRWFSSNECALGCTLGGSAGVGNGKSQVNVLCLLSNDSSMPSAGCHVDENHPISGMLRGSDYITARERKLFCRSKRGNVSSSAAIGV